MAARWPQAVALAGLLFCLQLAAAQDAVVMGEGGGDSGPQPSSGRIHLSTIFGKIPIRLFTTEAPETTRMILELAQQGCTQCNFYRNEAKPWQKTWPPVLQQGEGPPYSLLQGVMDISGVAPLENAIPVKMGHVCSIPGTKDFFISYGDHPEWANSHTVWGEVENDWLAVDLIISQDYNIVKHPEHGTEMRMLTEQVKFSVSADTPTETA